MTLIPKLSSFTSYLYIQKSNFNSLTLQSKQTNEKCGHDTFIRKICSTPYPRYNTICCPANLSIESEKGAKRKQQKCSYHLRKSLLLLTVLFPLYFDKVKRFILLYLYVHVCVFLYCARTAAQNTCYDASRAVGSTWFCAGPDCSPPAKIKRNAKKGLPKAYVYYI